MTQEHSPLPWVQHPSGMTVETDAISGTLDSVCQGYASRPEQTKGDMAFIVRACNSHYELIRALESLIDLCSQQKFANESASEAAKRVEIKRNARMALAKAEGKS